MHNRLKVWLDKSRIDPEEYVGRDEARNERVVREGFVAKAKRFLRQLPMAADTVAMYFCLLDSRTPTWVKVTVAGALAYFVMPADAIPDFIPVVGMGDDAAVLTAALTAIASHLTDEHRAKAREWMEHEHLVAPAS